MPSSSTLAGDLARRSLEAEQTLSRQDVLDKVRVVTLDFMAAACAGAMSQAARTASEVAASFGSGSCTLIGSRTSASPAAAALHNGLIGHAEELDDSHRYVSGLHLGVCVIPAALALAEDRGASGREYMAAVVAGCEAAGRLCRCIDQSHRRRGFHSTGTIGPFGAAAACSSLLKHDAVKLRHALGIAASSSAGLFSFLEDGATVKHWHAGRSALDGLSAALLAEAGMTGPAAVLEAREGFFRAYAEEADPSFLSCEFPGSDPEVLSLYHKLHSACGHSFPAVDAALELRKALAERSLDAGAITALRFESYRAAACLNNPRPSTPAEARFSIPFIIALALTRGHVAKADMCLDNIQDEQMLRLAGMVQIAESVELSAAFPKLRAGILGASLSTGEEIVLRVDAPRGMPDNPASMEELEDKFRREALPLLGAARTAGLLEAVRRLEHLSSIRELTSLLAG